MTYQTCVVLYQVQILDISASIKNHELIINKFIYSQRPRTNEKIKKNLTGSRISTNHLYYCRYTIVRVITTYDNGKYTGRGKKRKRSGRMKRESKVERTSMKKARRMNRVQELSCASLCRLAIFNEYSQSSQN